MGKGKTAKPCKPHSVIKCRRCYQDGQNRRNRKHLKNGLRGLQVFYNIQWVDKNKKRVAEYNRAYRALKKNKNPDPELMELYKEKYSKNND